MSHSERSNLLATLLADTNTYVVKVGSRVLSTPAGELDHERLRSLAAQITQLASAGQRVVLVSSGAVLAGMARLGLKSRPSNLAQLQAVASVGQAHLIQAYEQYFSALGRHVAQVLLIADDLDDRVRYLNVRNTLVALLEMGVTPIINENDSVAVDELLTTFGDNDRLAAMVAGVFRKPALIILSDVDGVYDRDPSAAGAKLLDKIEQIDDRILALASSHNSRVSKGGMASKLRAAQFATRSGSPVFIAGGRVDNVLVRLHAGESLGTLFLPQPTTWTPKQRWIGFAAQATGGVHVDAGACRAVQSKGSSLLAVGITHVVGTFEKGEVISIQDAQGVEIARGLSNYSAAELQKIKGLHSPSISAVLGHCPYDEAVHRDNLTLVDSGATPGSGSHFGSNTPDDSASAT